MSFASIDSILESTLDNLPDVPEFKPFAAGSHQATIAFEVKEIQKKPAVEWKLTHMETIELANPEDTPPKAGDTCSGAFIFLDKDGKENELALGQFKALLKPLQAHFGTTSNGETLEASQGATVVLTMTQRAGKAGTSSEGKFFPVIEAIAVV